MVSSGPGQGKSLALAISALQKIDLNSDELQILIIVPIRELTFDIELFKYPKFSLLQSIN